MWLQEWIQSSIYASTPAIALCFCVRDCGEYLPMIFENIDRLKTRNFIVYSIFVYDNCSDDSPNLLKEYAQKHPTTTIVRGIENNSDKRTIRISKARNECLKCVYELSGIKYHIMIDADDKNASQWNLAILEKYLIGSADDDWDCMTFNRDDYYDIWALMFDDFRHHCWGFRKKSFKVVNVMRKAIAEKIANSKATEVEVLSAFNGFGIYKTARFKGLTYAGTYKNVHDLIADHERVQTQKCLSQKYRIVVGLDITKDRECCEHLSYHLQAVKKGRKIKISKHKI